MILYSSTQVTFLQVESTSEIVAQNQKLAMLSK